MGATQRSGAAIVGAIFLLVGVLKFFGGGGWVVWIILGLLLGGLGVFSDKGASRQGDPKGGQ